VRLTALGRAPGSPPPFRRTAATQHRATLVTCQVLLVVI